MDNLSDGDLTIEASTGAKSIRLDWKGKSNNLVPLTVLAPYFKKLIEEAEYRGVAVEMHFEQIQHFNSSTITSLVLFLSEMKKKGLKLTLCYDGKLMWQRLSFDALRVFEDRHGLLLITEARSAA